MTQEQETSRQLRQLSAILAIASVPAFALCYALSLIDAAPFALGLAKAAALLVAAMSAGGALTFFLASLPGFKGDDAFRD